MAALEDKIVQKAACAVLNAIYEASASRTGSGPSAASTMRWTHSSPEIRLQTFLSAAAQLLGPLRRRARGDGVREQGR